MANPNWDRDLWRDLVKAEGCAGRQSREEKAHPPALELEPADLPSDGGGYERLSLFLPGGGELPYVREDIHNTEIHRAYMQGHADEREDQEALRKNDWIFFCLLGVIAGFLLAAILNAVRL